MDLKTKMASVKRKIENQLSLWKIIMLINKKVALGKIYLRERNNIIDYEQDFFR